MASLQKTIIQFEFDYLKVKDLSPGDFIESPSFVVGGYKWAIRFYSQVDEKIDGYVRKGLTHDLLLTLLSEARNVRVQFCLEILDKYNNVVAPGTNYSTFKTQGDSWGNRHILASSVIEATYGDSFFVHCIVEVLSEPKREVLKGGGFSNHMGELLKSEKRSDVTFEVDGKMFTAHRLIMAARSPVFEAELFSPMSEGFAKNIEIKGMRADVFEALLHFIYTDEVSDNGLIVDLLVAADRYAVTKLKAMCEERLLDDLCVENVLMTLVVADRHNCVYLKEKCLEFASKIENYKKIVFTEGFFGMGSYPGLLSELGEKVAKRQKTN